MVLTTPSAIPANVIWHDIECGAYRADMPLWLELARAEAPAGTAARILDIGAGAGRVSLELARAGHNVSALDLDGELLAALAQRAGSAEIEILQGDARAFALQEREFALCIIPMQTIQLLGGAAGRLDFLRCARAHLRPGGLLACAIVTQLDVFDCREQIVGPSAETATVGGMSYISRAVRVAIGRTRIRIERDRQILEAGHDPARASSAPERDVIELDRLSAARLLREGREAGLTAAGTRTIAATDEHVGGEVVLLRA